MKRLILLCLLLQACKHTTVPLPETFEQMLVRTEGVTCATITTHDTGAPTPDCRKLYDAFVRGRTRVARLYPAAVNIKMTALSLLQTRVIWNSKEPFPRTPTGAMAYTGNGTTLIQYAFEETIEHETTHVLVFLLDGLKKRTQEALDNPKDADQKDYQFTYLYQITCHNTTDDPFGDGTSLSISGRASCIQPYSGPVPLVVPMPEMFVVQGDYR